MKKSSEQSRQKHLTLKFWLLIIGVLILVATAVTIHLLTISANRQGKRSEQGPAKPVAITAQGVNVDKDPTKMQADTLQIDGFTAREAEFTGTVTNDWRVVRFGSYDGVFVEQGRQEEASHPATLALVLTNLSGSMAEYAELTLQTGSGEAVFVLTNIPAGQTVLVQESTALQFESNAVYSAPDASVCVRTDDKTLLEQSLEITAMDGIVNLHNITAQTLNDVRICYKAVTDGIYFGGITYCIRGGTIAMGQTAQCVDKDYSFYGNELLFATLGDE